MGNYGSAGAGAAGSAAMAGLAAAGGGTPLSLILPIAFSLLNGLGIFGGGEDPELEYRRNRTQGQLDSVLRQMIGQGKHWNAQAMGLSPVVLQAVMNNYRRMANFGHPEGMQMDLSFLDDLFSGGVMNPGGIQRRA